MAFLDLTGLTRFKNKIMNVIDTKKQKSDEAIAIVSDNNTHAALSAWQYVYIKNHSTLAEGLYQAIRDINANASLTLSNVTAVSNGGLNSLKTQVDVQESRRRSEIDQVWSGMAIFSDDNVHKRIGIGEYVYIRNTSDLSDGLYQNTSGNIIAQDAALNDSNVTYIYEFGPGGGGGLNALKSDLDGHYNSITATTPTFDDIPVNAMGRKTFTKTSGSIPTPSGDNMLGNYLKIGTNNGERYGILFIDNEGNLHSINKSSSSTPTKWKSTIAKQDFLYQFTSTSGTSHVITFSRNGNPQSHLISVSSGNGNIYAFFLVFQVTATGQLRIIRLDDNTTNLPHTAGDNTITLTVSSARTLSIADVILWGGEDKKITVS